MTDYLDKMDVKYEDDEAMRLYAFEAAVKYGRDSSRTPMQWSAGPNAGFSSVEPWIPLNENYAVFNAEDQAGDAESILNFWRELLRTRKLHKDALIYGDFSLVNINNEQTITYIKSSEDDSRRYLVSLNFSDRVARLFVPDSLAGMKLDMQVSTTPEPGQKEFLGPWEGRLYLVDKSTM